MALTFISLPVFSQVADTGVGMSYQKDSVQIVRAETFSNKLIFYNMSDKTLLLRKVSVVEGSLIDLPDTLSLAPGSQRIFFSQYLADPVYLRRIGSSIKTVYQYGRHLLIDSFFLKTPNENQLIITPFAKEVYLDVQSGQTQAQISIQNNGYTPIKFSLEGKSFPEGVKIYSKNKSFVLQAGEQQIITLELKNYLNSNLSHDFKFYLTAIDNHGERLTQAAFNLLNLSSEKQFAVGSSGYPTQMNGIQLGYLSGNSGFNNLYVSAKGNQQINADGILDYQLNYRYYTKPIQGSEIFDTYISYEKSGFALRFGSLMENTDFSAYGQGAEAKIGLGEDQQLTTFYLQKNYLLYSNVFSGLKGADVWGVKYDFQEAKENAAQVTLLNSNDPITDVKTQLVHGSKAFKLSEKAALNLEAGLSNEKLMGGHGGVNKLGAAFGVSYHAHYGQVSIGSTNYYSSPYYGGLHRGSIQLNESISVEVGRHWSTYWQLDHQANKPEYLNTYYSYWNQNSRQSIYGWGIGKRWSKFYFSLKPYYFRQHLDQFINDQSQIANSNAWHLETNGTFYSGSHQLNLRTDYGFVRSDNPYYFQDGTRRFKSYQDWRLSLGYSYKFAGIDLSFQHNPYYIFEEPNAWQKDDYRQYSIGPYINLNLLHKRIQFKASSYINYNGYWDYWTNNYQLEANWSISKLWQVQALSTILTFQGQTNAYQQTSVSIQRNFLKKNDLGFHQWTMRFYGDLNNNGHWDKEETAIEGVIASIDGIPAVSDRQGRMRFLNLSPKSYQLLIVSGRDWVNLDTISQLVDKNIRQDIPLIKSSQVAGVIIGKTNPYTLQRPALEGISIHAVSNRGDRYTTLSDGQGKFNFYLPCGNYEIFLESLNGQYDVIVGRTAISVTAEENQQNAAIRFEIIDATKKVEIQHF